MLVVLCVLLLVLSLLLLVVVVVIGRRRAARGSREHRVRVRQRGLRLISLMITITLNNSTYYEQVF